MVTSPSLALKAGSSGTTKWARARSPAAGGHALEPRAGTMHISDSEPSPRKAEARMAFRPAFFFSTRAEPPEPMSSMNRVSGTAGSMRSLLR